MDFNLNPTAAEKKRSEEKDLPIEGLAAAAWNAPMVGNDGELMPVDGKKERKPFEATDTDQKTNIVAILNPNPSLQHIHTQMGCSHRLDGPPKLSEWRFTP